MNKKPQPMVAKTSPWRNRQEAAAHLGVSPQLIDKLKRRGLLTPKYVGTIPLYAVEDLDKIPA